MSETTTWILPFSVDLAQPLKKTYLDMVLATEDNKAHRFDISLYRNGEPLELPSGVSVSAYFIRYCDNGTLPLTGSASGNVFSVTLEKACYNRFGAFALVIKATEGDTTSTVFYAEGSVFVSRTDTLIDTENVVPSLDDLLAQIATIEAATAAANTAADNANSATESANTAAGNASTAAAKIDGMTVSAEDADAAEVTITEVDGVKHIAFALPKGDKGDKGDPGTIENVTITSIDGLQEALAGKLGTDETAADSSRLGGFSLSEIMLKLYPVGSIYMSVNKTSPASLFGGTWEQLKDRFLLGAGDSYTAGSTGGEATHTLIDSELPRTEGAISIHGGENGSNYWNATGVFGGSGTVDNYKSFSAQVSSAATSLSVINFIFGGNQPHNNMPPYLTVNMWKRVS